MAVPLPSRVSIYRYIALQTIWASRTAISKETTTWDVTDLPIHPLPRHPQPLRVRPIHPLQSPDIRPRRRPQNDPQRVPRWLLRPIQRLEFRSMPSTDGMMWTCRIRALSGTIIRAKCTADTTTTRCATLHPTIGCVRPMEYAETEWPFRVQCRIKTRRLQQIRNHHRRCLLREDREDRVHRVSHQIKT